MSELSKQYTPSDHEQLIYERWEESGAFQPDQAAVASGKKPFVISLPPPNITGSLHMGHALQDTIMDILSRYHRMQGRPVAWLPGTDSAALPTNKIINEQLAAAGTNRHEIGREAFDQRTADWYAKTGAQITNQMRRLGCSCDWSRDRFTLDKQYIQAVNQAFLTYYEQGYIYRGSRIVNWDPTTQTTVSDLEIEYRTAKSTFYYFQYGPFAIGTARPETKFADKYVVIHPNDERYRNFKHGDTFTAEWINGPITATVIKDEAVDPTVGSGAMTITPWHSAVDFELAKKYDLDMEQIIDLDGTLLPVAGEFVGMHISEARDKIVTTLDHKGLLIRIDDAYEHTIAVNDRGKGVIEPQVMRQWFVDMSKLKQPAIDAVEEGLVTFVPPRWKQHFIEWMQQVYDWNINRQIWLGHRLPVWWRVGTHGTDNEAGNYVVSLDKPAGEWQQDPDVLDTWFATALWPFAQLGWPDNTNDLQQFYPTSVLVTARDILYLWVARMVFSGLELMQGETYGNRSSLKRIPFSDVFIHPTVLAKDGRRMSKSLGTGVDPLDLIDQYGADATRFGLMYMMSYDNQAIRFDEATIKAARNFANKLWNIARLLQSDRLVDREPTAADQWITNAFNQQLQTVDQMISEYKLGEASRALYQFVWNTYADQYLEYAKYEGSRTTARTVFLSLLQLLHPFMPFITETLWQHFEQSTMLITSFWPKPLTIDYQALVTDIPLSMMQLHYTISAINSVRTMLAIPHTATTIVYLKTESILPAALQSITRSILVGERTDDMKEFPIAADFGSIAIASEHITEERLTAARAKIAVEQTKLTQLRDQITASLNTMRAKAPESAIRQKEEQLERVVRRLTELENSLAALVL